MRVDRSHAVFVTPELDGPRRFFPNRGSLGNVSERFVPRLNRGPNFFRVKAENFVAGEHIRSTQDGIAARGMGHDQARDLEIVAQPGIGFFGLGLRQPDENAMSEWLDRVSHPELLPAVSRAS